MFIHVFLLYPNPPNHHGLGRGGTRPNCQDPDSSHWSGWSQPKLCASNTSAPKLVRTQFVVLDLKEWLVDAATDPPPFRLKLSAQSCRQQPRPLWIIGRIPSCPPTLTATTNSYNSGRNQGSCLLAKIHPASAAQFPLSLVTNPAQSTVHFILPTINIFGKCL